MFFELKIGQNFDFSVNTAEKMKINYPNNHYYHNSSTDNCVTNVELKCVFLWCRYSDGSQFPGVERCLEEFQRSQRKVVHGGRRGHGSTVARHVGRAETIAGQDGGFRHRLRKSVGRTAGRDRHPQMGRPRTLPYQSGVIQTELQHFLPFSYNIWTHWIQKLD